MNRRQYEQKTHTRAHTLGKRNKRVSKCTHVFSYIESAMKRLVIFYPGIFLWYILFIALFYKLLVLTLYREKRYIFSYIFHVEKNTI